METDGYEVSTSGQFKIDYIQSPSGERIPFVEPLSDTEQNSSLPDNIIEQI